MSRAEAATRPHAIHPGGVVGEILITAGVLVLVFALWQFWWTDVTADQAQADTVASLEGEFGERDLTASTGAGRSIRPGSGDDLQNGRPFAVVSIPRFGAKYARPVLEGTSSAELRKGIGHTPGTAQPGQVGNFATAGHRVTYGKPYAQIDRLRVGDAIVVETRDGWSVYRLVRSRIVRPNATEVLSPVPDRPGVRATQAWMTLVACHPAYSARERYIGYARLDRFVPRSEGVPRDVLAPPSS